MKLVSPSTNSIGPAPAIFVKLAESKIAATIEQTKTANLQKPSLVPVTYPIIADEQIEHVSLTPITF